MKKSLNIGFDSQRIGVAIAVGISVCACTEGKVGEGMPVLEIVATNKG